MNRNLFLIVALIAIILAGQICKLHIVLDCCIIVLLGWISYFVIDEADAGSCGCPKTETCQNNCVQRGFTVGRCQGLFSLSCACLKGLDWINMSYQCWSCLFAMHSKFWIHICFTWYSKHLSFVTWHCNSFPNKRKNRRKRTRVKSFNALFIACHWAMSTHPSLTNIQFEQQNQMNHVFIQYVNWHDT
jgi:hypothetical protein